MEKDETTLGGESSPGTGEDPKEKSKEEEKLEPAEKDISEKEIDPKAEEEKKAEAEKEEAEKAEKEAKAEAPKKKANKKRSKKKKTVKEAEHVPKRIRILMSLANAERAYTPGQSYEVGKDVSVESARNYLKNGLAEVDMAAQGPSETK